MKNMLLLIVAMGLCILSFGKPPANTLKLNNTTNCTLYFTINAADPPNCDLMYTSNIISIAPGGSLVYDYSTVPWATTPVPADPLLTWVRVTVSNQPACVSTGGGSCPPDINNVSAACFTNIPVSCFKLTNTCTGCATGTIVNLKWTNTGGGNVLVTMY
jgi:hypothetical protein